MQAAPTRRLRRCGETEGSKPEAYKAISDILYATARYHRLGRQAKQWWKISTGVGPRMVIWAMLELVLNDFSSVAGHPCQAIDLVHEVVNTIGVA